MESLEDEIALPTEELSLQADTPVSIPEQLPSITSLSTSETKKRPNSLTLKTSSPTKVRLSSFEYDDTPQTPNQPTIPKNPAFSGTQSNLLKKTIQSE